MAFDCKQRKPLLYADLFKQNQKTAMSETSTCSSSWNESSLCDSSSSSGFSTPFGSEFESSESDEVDFTAELTRQMAECMLQEDDEEEVVIVEEEKDRGNSVADSTRQVYQVANQPRVKKQVPVSPGRRVKATELAQQSQFDTTEQRYQVYRGRDWRVGKGQTGSDMRVVFLGGSGSASRSGLINGSSGTGVFLPRAVNEPVSVQLKKKPGCPTALIPTRVLEVLELHFNRLSDSAGPLGSNVHSCPKDEGHNKSSGQRNRHSHEAKKDEVMQLPQEWTY